MTTVNGTDVGQIERYREQVRQDQAVATRRPALVARWLGGSRSEVELGDATIRLGGDEELNAMQALLGCLAACDVDLVAMHAALMGIEIRELWVEATGEFNVARYLGLDGADGPGYRSVEYAVHVTVTEATEDQIRRLRELCEQASPVGDTLRRAVPLSSRVDVRTTTGPVAHHPEPIDA